MPRHPVTTCLAQDADFGAFETAALIPHPFPEYHAREPNRGKYSKAIAARQWRRSDVQDRYDNVKAKPAPQCRCGLFVGILTVE
jgi:hypothetical protein